MVAGNRCFVGYSFGGGCGLSLFGKSMELRHCISRSFLAGCEGINRIILDVPAGKSEIRISFARTPDRVAMRYRRPVF
jgi:hypothetical protein